MAKYIHKFNTESAFTETYNSESYIEPWVSFTQENEKVDYNKPPINEKIINDLRTQENLSHLRPWGLMVPTPTAEEYSQYWEYESFWGNIFNAGSANWDYCSLEELSEEQLDALINSDKWQYTSGKEDILILYEGNDYEFDEFVWDYYWDEPSYRGIIINAGQVTGYREGVTDTLFVQIGNKRFITGEYSSNS